MHSSSPLLWTAVDILLANMSDTLLVTGGRNNLKLLEPKKKKWLAQRSQKCIKETSLEMQSDPDNSWKLGLTHLSPSHLFTHSPSLPKLSSPIVRMHSYQHFVSSLDLKPQERMTVHPAFPSPTPHGYISKCSHSYPHTYSPYNNLTWK